MARSKKPVMHRQVYIIEIMEKWYPEVAPDLPEGKRCFYVGETGKEPGVRFKEHRSRRSIGGNPPSSGKIFKKMRRIRGLELLARNGDVRLRRKMAGKYRSVSSKKAKVLKGKAKKLEGQVIDELRAQGHAVHPKQDGTIPFEKYRSGDRLG